MARLLLGVINVIVAAILWTITAVLVYYVAVKPLPSMISELQLAMKAPALSSWEWWIPAAKFLLAAASVILLLLGIYVAVRYLSLGFFESGKWLRFQLSPEAASERFIMRIPLFDRVNHMILVLGFFMCLSGFILYFGDNAYIYGFLYLGGRDFLANIHVIGGYVVFFAVTLHISRYLTLFLLYAKDRGLRGAIRAFPLLRLLPSLPRDLLHYYLWLFFLRKEHPKYHKYMPTQTIAYYAIGALLLISGVTGFSMVLYGMQSGDGLAWWVHLYSSLFLTVLITFHVFMTSLRPEYFPLDLTLFTGEVPERAAREEWPLWVEEVRGEKA
ncbi:MAG: hypothetical protein N3F67_05160 [Acidilobaceae archaeon]|nr:hypothetical protein [Acidilobaceae archaeon]